jgi:hypothetical protein
MRHHALGVLPAEVVVGLGGRRQLVEQRMAVLVHVLDRSLVLPLARLVHHAQGNGCVLGFDVGQALVGLTLVGRDVGVGVDSALERFVGLLHTTVCSHRPVALTRQALGRTRQHHVSRGDGPRVRTVHDLVGQGHAFGRHVDIVGKQPVCIVEPVSGDK